MKITHALRLAIFSLFIISLAACAGTGIHPTASVMIGGSTGTN